MRMLFKAWQDWLAEQTYYVYDQGLAHISDLHQAKQVGNMRWKPVLHAMLCCFYDVVARGRNKTLSGTERRRRLLLVVGN